MSNFTLKAKQVVELAATTGGNISIDSGTFVPGTSFPSDSYTHYRVTGTKILSSALAIVASGTVLEGTYITILWEAVITPSGNAVTIFGETVPEELVNKNFIAECRYDGSAWTVVIIPDWVTTAIVNSDRLETDAVTTVKIADNAVTLAKMAGLATGLIIVGDSSGDPSTVDLSKDGMLLIGDASAGAAGYVMSGDVTMSKTGVVKIGASKVLNSMIDSMDAAKLTGTVAAARIAADSLPSTKLSDLGKQFASYSASGTSAVTTEEILVTHTLAAGLVDADGEGVHIIAFGSTAGNANAKTIKLKIGGNTIVTNTTTTSPNGLNWHIDLRIKRSGATSCVAFGTITFDGVATEIDTSKPTITWANALAIELTGQNGTASANDIVSEMVDIYHIK